MTTETTEVLPRPTRMPEVLEWTVREVAESRGILSAKALSEATGVPYREMLDMWRGHSSTVPLAHLARLCRYFDVPVSHLLYYTPDGRVNASPFVRGGRSPLL